MLVELENVASVYSGKNGRCCCGCAGKHTYASKFKDYSSEERGYKVTDDEVNDRTVKTIVNRINKNEDKLDMKEPDFVSVVINNRLLIAYLKKN